MGTDKIVRSLGPGSLVDVGLLLDQRLRFSNR